MTAPKLTIGDKTFDVPPLDAGVFEDYADAVNQLQRISGVPTGDEAKALITLAHVITQAAKLDLTREQVRAGISPATRLMTDVTPAVMWALGFRKAEPGEAASPSTST